jgi:hypothetical protein
VPGPVFIFCAPGVVSCGTEGVRSRFHILRARTYFRRYRGRQLLFSYFARTDSFSAVPSPSFMFCVPGVVSRGTKGVGSRFHVLRPRTHFRLYRGRRVPFECFVRTDIFSAVPRASSPVFIFSAPGLVFGGTEGIGSYFHVLRAQTHFRPYRGRSVPFSRFALSELFSAVPSASGPVFMFCAPELIFDGT